MKALVLAAGYATRLYPLTREFPKPLLTVRERPIIDYIIDKLGKVKDIDEIIVVTNNKFISLFKKWADEIESRKPIRLVNDLSKSHDDMRGAIGDMNFVLEKEHINDNLLVIGGDNLFDSDLGDFISFAKTHQPNPAIGAYDIKDKLYAKKYGVIRMDKKNQVIDFKEKPDKPNSTLVAMCLYYFPKERLSLTKKYLDNKHHKHDATGFYIDWLTKEVAVYGFVFKGRWYDIGHREFYHQAKDTFIQ